VYNSWVPAQRPDDPALIERIARHDEAALSELYDRYSRLVYSVAYRVVGDHGAAEEITLDVFSRVWEKAGAYQPERAKVLTWISRMTRNRAIDILRREEVRPLKHSIGWADAPSEPVATGQDPEQAVGLALEMERVRVVMAGLPPEQQETLALAYFKGYTHSEIAQVLDLPLGTVKGRIRAGMQKLRRALTDD
jgi:RNA polymerase sigma-70 factor (ECF subfamily)